MDLRSGLRRNVTAESPAYGYTLTIWGSGAILVTETSITGLGILAFVFGGIVGFGFLAALAFKSLIKKFSQENAREMLAASMVHILASLGAVAFNYILIRGLPGNMETVTLALLVGFSATVSYNILLLLEQYLYRDLYEIETKIQE